MFDRAAKPWTQVARSVLGIVVLSSVACAGRMARAHENQQLPSCPAGTYDYGSGMVAATLPSEISHVLRDAHEQVLEQAGSRLSAFLADQPWRPHISVMYGVTNQQVESIERVLEHFSRQTDGVSACFGSLVYWDDPFNAKTTLVIEVVEKQSLLHSINQALSQATHVQPRFAYHPHVTLAYLAPKSRLTTSEEDRVEKIFKNSCWTSEGFYITDPCGQTVMKVELGVEPQRTGANPPLSR